MTAEGVANEVVLALKAALENVTLELPDGMLRDIRLELPDEAWDDARSIVEDGVGKSIHDGILDGEAVAATLARQKVIHEEAMRSARHTRDFYAEELKRMPKRISGAAEVVREQCKAIHSDEWKERDGYEKGYADGYADGRAGKVIGPHAGEDLPWNEMSCRARGVCRREETLTFGQLAGKTRREMRKARNCGETTVRELEDLLASRGMDFRDAFTPPKTPSASS